MFLRGFEGWHLVIIAGLLVVLFGARKLPDSARSIGQSLRIFKSEMKAAQEESDSAEPLSQPQSQAQAQPQVLAPHAGPAQAGDQHSAGPRERATTP